jgi:hypothetical protein
MVRVSPSVWKVALLAVELSTPPPYRVRAKAAGEPISLSASSRVVGQLTCISSWWNVRVATGVVLMV